MLGAQVSSAAKEKPLLRPLTLIGVLILAAENKPLFLELYVRSYCLRSLPLPLFALGFQSVDRVPQIAVAAPIW